MEPVLYCRGSKWKGPSRLNGKLVLIKAHDFGTASQAQGAHEHGFAPGLPSPEQVPQPRARPTAVLAALGEFSPRELRKVLVGAKNHMFKGWGRWGGTFFFTSCCIMNSPFQGMCEFLLGLSECCKIFSGNVCPSFQTNGFLCIRFPLLSAFPSHLWYLVLPGQRLMEMAVPASHPLFVQWTLAGDGNLQLFGAKQTGRWSEACEGSWTLSSYIQWGQWRTDLDPAIDFWGLNILPGDILKYLWHLQGATRIDSGPVGDPYRLGVTVGARETPEEIPNIKQVHEGW